MHSKTFLALVIGTVFTLPLAALAADKKFDSEEPSELPATGNCDADRSADDCQHQHPGSTGAGTSANSRQNADAAPRTLPRDANAPATLNRGTDQSATTTGGTPNPTNQSGSVASPAANSGSTSGSNAGSNSGSGTGGSMGGSSAGSH